MLWIEECVQTPVYNRYTIVTCNQFNSCTIYKELVDSKLTAVNFLYVPKAGIVIILFVRSYMNPSPFDRTFTNSLLHDATAQNETPYKTKTRVEEIFKGGERELHLTKTVCCFCNRLNYIKTKSYLKG